MKSSDTWYWVAVGTAAVVGLILFSIGVAGA